MEKNYRYELTALYGDPVDENPVGVMMEAGYQKLGLNYRYLNMHVKEENLEDAIKAIRALGIKGVNLTIPHKVKAIPMLDELSEAAEIIGAVNVIVNHDGVLRGENTDGEGFMIALEKAGVTVKGKKVFMIGAGGAARAIGTECALAGAKELVIANRSRDRGEELVSMLREKTGCNCNYVEWNGKLQIPEDTDVLVNATSIGLYPDTNKPNIDYDTIKNHMAVSDVIFNPPETGFLKEAAKRGAVTIDGLGMLAYQGAKAFEIWTDHKAPEEVLVEALKKEFKN